LPVPVAPTMTHSVGSVVTSTLPSAQFQPRVCCCSVHPRRKNTQQLHRTAALAATRHRQGSRHALTRSEGTPSETARRSPGADGLGTAHDSASDRSQASPARVRRIRRRPPSGASANTWGTTHSRTKRETIRDFINTELLRKGSHCKDAIVTGTAIDTDQLRLGAKGIAAPPIGQAAAERRLS